MAVEKRVYLREAGEEVLIGIADVSVNTSQPQKTLTSHIVTIIQTLEVEIAIAQEVQERFLEIREVATGFVITTIEQKC